MLKEQRLGFYAFIFSSEPFAPTAEAFKLLFFHEISQAQTSQNEQFMAISAICCSLAPNDLPLLHAFMQPSSVISSKMF